MGAGPRRGVAPLDERFAAPGHGRAGAADRVGAIEIGDRINEWLGPDRSHLAERSPGSARRLLDLAEARVRRPHALAQLGERVEGPRPVERPRTRAQNGPGLAG